MLNFFKLNDPYRVIFVFLGLLIAWIPSMMDNPLTIPELNWMIIGEQLGNGNILYRDLWTETGPLAAGVYWILDSIFGRSQFIYMFLALILVCYQSLLFNRILLKNESFSQPNYVPALIYASLSILSFDFMTLSPQLMATTFFLLALDFVFNHIRQRVKQDEKIQYIGFFLVMATLFYFPYFVFLPGFLLVLGIFTGTIPRRFFLILYGFFIPLVLVGMYYWYRNGFTYFLDQFILTDFFEHDVELLTTNTLILIASVPLLFILFGLIRMFGRTRFTNFQITLVQVILLLAVFAAIGFWISPTKPPHSLLIFLPFAAFIISHYFVLIRSRFMSEMIFLAFISLVVLWNYGTLFRFSPSTKWIDYNRLVVQETEWDGTVRGKKVLLLNSKIEVLRESELAGPFLTWRIAQNVFNHPDKYENVILVYKSFRKEPPDLIIDPQGRMDKFFEKIPELQSQYSRSGQLWIKN